MKIIGLSFEVRDKQGFYIACTLFLLQFIYFQFQESLIEIIDNDMPRLRELLLLLPVTDLKAVVHCFDIIVHALFSIAIVWFLHKDKNSTLLVAYMSILLFMFYVVVNVIEKYTGGLIIQLITVTVRNFLASPFKTIFSIPALLLKHGEEVEEHTAT
ncbi:MAG: hypothetical protein RIG62_13535 [Cyclobacteriaceae bacterium]